MRRNTRKQDSHEFSLYFPELSNVLASKKADQRFSIDDAKLHHRMMRVLRFEQGDQFILFDRTMFVRFQLESYDTKRTVHIQLLEKNFTKPLKPAIVFFLPLLKRDALEQVLYSLVELGATEVHLMMTEKVQRSWGGQKEFDRLQTIMIAAAEQSKQYCIPELYIPKPFAECVVYIKPDHSFFFDPHGADIFPILESYRTDTPPSINLMVGPEGDLTKLEKQILKEHGVPFYCLTPTILRAQQAVAVSVGIFRSIV